MFTTCSPSFDKFFDASSVEITRTHLKKSPPTKPVIRRHYWTKRRVTHLKAIARGGNLKAPSLENTQDVAALPNQAFELLPLVILVTWGRVCSAREKIRMSFDSLDVYSKSSTIINLARKYNRMKSIVGSVLSRKTIDCREQDSKCPVSILSTRQSLEEEQEEQRHSNQNIE